MPGPAPAEAPYGAWDSPIGIDDVAGAALPLAEARADAGAVLWIEGRPAEGGRRTLLRRDPSGRVTELTPAPFNARSRVHEYGGGTYLAEGGRVIVSSFADGRLHEIDPTGATAPVALTPEGPFRYGDLRLDPARPRCYAVRETHDPADDRPATVRNEVVAIELEGPARGSVGVLVTGPDFVAAPRPSPDGGHLAWVEWDDPAMPWDATRLRLAPIGPDGLPGPARTVAGGDGTSVVEPSWSPDGRLVAASDEGGWWNLAVVVGPAGSPAAAPRIAPMAAEQAAPPWLLDRAGHAWWPDGTLLVIARSAGRDRLLRVGVDGGVEPLLPAITELEGVRAAGELAVVVGAGPADPAAVLLVDPRTGAVAATLAWSLAEPPPAGALPVPEPIEFPAADGGTARALLLLPRNDGYRAPAGELPPLLVLAHGGPTAAASSALQLDRAFFTSRGIAVVDVDYRGSTGYGRAYRDALRGAWGVADVEDCVAAARHLVERGLVDPRRIVIRGGSAGGFTVLASLATHPASFAAGISHYGIADLELLHEDGHKFEARYEESLVAPWPEGRAVFRERSPIHRIDWIRAPLLLLQGLDDRVVPPSQLEAMTAAFGARGIPHVALVFEGEGHGFRRAETRRAAYRAELGFLARVLGFRPAGGIEPLEIPGFPG